MTNFERITKDSKTLMEQMVFGWESDFFGIMWGFRHDGTIEVFHSVEEATEACTQWLMSV